MKNGTMSFKETAIITFDKKKTVIIQNKSIVKDFFVSLNNHNAMEDGIYLYGSSSLELEVDEGDFLKFDSEHKNFDARILITNSKK